MKKARQEYSKQCFDQLLFDYQNAQIENEELKEIVAELKRLCMKNGIDITNQ